MKRWVDLCPLVSPPDLQQGPLLPALKLISSRASCLQAFVSISVHWLSPPRHLISSKAPFCRHSSWSAAVPPACRPCSPKVP
eukprot:1160358-Pelagomonas_calceolata.AAC.3